MNRPRSHQRQWSFQYLEDYVRKFVGDKTGLGVRLDLRTEWVGIKSQEANGSVALAMFWAKVLQHRDNFPTDRVHYHASRDSQTGTDRLLIRVEDVTICLNLSTGLLEITGPQALIWLKKRFVSLLRVYDGFKDTAGWYEDDFPDGYDDGRVKAGQQLVTLGPASEAQQVDAILDGVWQGQSLESRLERARIPSVQPTSDFVHPLIRSLLARWLSDGNTQVCLVTTELDHGALLDLCQLACRFKSTANFAFLCAPFRANPRDGQDLPGVRLAAMRCLPHQDQMWLEYKLLRQFTSPMTGSGLNLLAGLRLGQAQVLVTSAPFHSGALGGGRGRADLVQFLQLTESVFMHDFIQPLNFSAN